MNSQESENQQQIQAGEAELADQPSPTADNHVSLFSPFTDSHDAGNTATTTTSDLLMSSSSSGRRRESLTQKDAKKSKKKKKKKLKKGKRSSYFSNKDDGSTVQVTNSGVIQDIQDYGSDVDEETGEHPLVRAPSVHFLPPPPTEYSLSNNPAEDTERTKGGGSLGLTNEEAPGVVQVRAAGTTTTRPAMTSEASEDTLETSHRSDNVSRSRDDIMAQAELVQHTVVAAANVGPDPLTDELQSRVRILEADKAEREGDGCPIKLQQGQMRCLIALLLLIGGVTIAAVAYVVGRESVTIATESPTPLPARIPSSSPSFYPSSFPSLYPTLLPTVDFEQLWVSLIQSRSPATNFNNATSPERQALDWMLQDPFTISVFDDENRVLQRFALSVIFYATGGSLRGWLQDSTECGWGGIGVTLGCGNSDNVEYMDMAESDLVGTVPKEIGLLTDLRSLRLSSNKFEGTIPTEIGILSNLTKLDLSYIRSLKGTIPTEIGRLTSLTYMGLYGSEQLEGTIPTESGLLLKCGLYSIYDLSLNGTLPSEVGMMTLLTIFDVSGNRDLSGTIPSELAELTGIDMMHLYRTQLSGSIPSSLCDIEREMAINCENVSCNCCVGPYPQLTPCEPTVVSPGRGG